MTKLKIALLSTIFALSIGAGAAFAQSDDTPTPEAPVSEATEAAPVVVIVEQPEPTEPAPTTTVQSFLLTGAIFAGLGVLTFVFWQNGRNLKVVAGTIPPEVAQLIFRVGMTQALTTEEVWDDEALKEAAKQLGYEVVSDGNGGFTIRASARAVAQNAQPVKDDLYRG